jgi:hypothetical protein
MTVTIADRAADCLQPLVIVLARRCRIVGTSRIDPLVACRPTSNESARQIDAFLHAPGLALQSPAAADCLLPDSNPHA